MKVKNITKKTLKTSIFIVSFTIATIIFFGIPILGAYVTTGLIFGWW